MNESLVRGPATARVSEPQSVPSPATARRLQESIAKVVIGQARAVRLITTAIFARGHVLLEGDVGVGKTTLLRAAARAIGGAFERIEGTIDLMPSDMIYHTYIAEDGRPRVERGPILKHGPDLSIFFFNEINRARPQVHSLLLRLMAERSVTAFNAEHSFPHLLVFADRNRIEREETFELPAAARDRFLMEIPVAAPTDGGARRALVFDTRYHDVDSLIASATETVVDYKALSAIGSAIQHSITVSPALEAYVLALWEATRTPADHGIVIGGVDMTRLVAGGASPRGMSYLIRAARVAAWMDGRDMVVPEDIRDLFPEVMAHRIFLQPVYELRRDELVQRLISETFKVVPVP